MAQQRAGHGAKPVLRVRVVQVGLPDHLHTQDGPCVVDHPGQYAQPQQGLEHPSARGSQRVQLPSHSKHLESSKEPSQACDAEHGHARENIAFAQAEGQHPQVNCCQGRHDRIKCTPFGRNKLHRRHRDSQYASRCSDCTCQSSDSQGHLQQKNSDKKGLHHIHPALVFHAHCQADVQRIGNDHSSNHPLRLLALNPMRLHRVPPTILSVFLALVDLPRFRRHFLDNSRLPQLGARVMCNIVCISFGKMVRNVATVPPPKIGPPLQDLLFLWNKPVAIVQIQQL
mmetsp:Transcript_57022/g.152322  ORF Transcript_57022/g.152322 Transcript_57022/m.152322 type:complete len:284 (-) Transcript_57022:273-1124(-)